MELDVWLLVGSVVVIAAIVAVRLAHGTGLPSLLLYLAFGLLLGESGLGIRFDDMELAAHVHPPLTTVRTDPFGWGRACARVLLDLIEGADVGDEEFTPAELVIRDSTGPAPR